ncbi:hypothetical protein D3C81_978540 [compost metagenome]
MRITSCVVRVKSNHIQQFFNPFFTFCPRTSHTMNIKSFTNNICYSKTRIQRCIRILEYHLHIPAHSFHLFWRQLCNIRSIEHDTTRSRLVQTKNRPSSCRFTTTRFTNETQCFAFSNGEADIIYSFKNIAATYIKVFFKAINLNQILAHCELPSLAIGCSSQQRAVCVSLNSVAPGSIRSQIFIA